MNEKHGHRTTGETDIRFTENAHAERGLSFTDEGKYYGRHWNQVRFFKKGKLTLTGNDYFVGSWRMSSFANFQPNDFGLATESYFVPGGATGSMNAHFNLKGEDKYGSAFTFYQLLRESDYGH